jgi:hypothetical protein
LRVAFTTCNSIMGCAQTLVQEKQFLTLTMKGVHSLSWAVPFKAVSAE